MYVYIYMYMCVYLRVCECAYMHTHARTHIKQKLVAEHFLIFYIPYLSCPSPVPH